MEQSPSKQPGVSDCLHRPALREPLKLREFGTWEVNSLIKTIQNPNFAEWQFGGKKKPQQWENVGYAAQTFSSQGINYKNTHSAISIQMNT